MLSCLEGSELRKLDVLVFLVRKGTASLSQIASELKVREDAVKTTVEELKRKGIVVTYPDEVVELNYASPVVSILLSLIKEIVNC